MFESRSREALLELVPDAELDAMTVGFNLLRAANRLQQDLETNVHRPAGLTFAAFRILFTLRALGPLAPRQIAGLSHVSPSSISSVLGTLERRGLIARARGVSADARIVLVQLTEAGEEVVRIQVALQNEREADWVQALDPRERRSLAVLLRKLLAHRPGAAAEGPEPL
jgi:DNA-binding MarR family transcriptional regulator